MPAHPRLHTRFCDLVGVEYPIVQTGMGWVSGAGLTAATASAGGLGLIASATMDFAQLRGAIAQVKRTTTNPFGVNLRADAADIGDRIKLLVDEQVKVASFAQAPKEALIGRLHDGGVLVVPSIGAKRHAEKVLEWGVDAVLVQGGEGGGHTGSVPTTILLPQVVDAVQGRVPVIAAGGFFDGRGLVAALAYGADAIAMGTRFLLSADSAVPQSVKEEYLSRAVTDTVVTKQIDGVPHRMLDTDLVEEVESAHGKIWALPRASANAWRFHKLSGIKVRAMAKEGLAMRKSLGLTWTQTMMAANAPMLTKAALVDGKVESGVLPSGQVVGVIDDLPTCKELIDRIVAEATDVLHQLTLENVEESNV
jgi:NAD(P)H-dependent flavin oxidoreductase YrpB (nitropropane dioxygenase family)